MQTKIGCFLPLVVYKSQKQAAESPGKCMINQAELNLGANAGNRVHLTQLMGRTLILMTQLVDRHGLLQTSSHQ